jgi:hypothetical protein
VRYGSYDDWIDPEVPTFKSKEGEIPLSQPLFDWAKPNPKHALLAIKPLTVSGHTIAQGGCHHRKTCGTGDFRLRWPTTAHRIEVEAPCWTLFVTGQCIFLNLAPVGPPGTLAFPPLVGAKRTSEDGGRSAPRDRDDVIGLRRILRMQRTQTCVILPAGERPLGRGEFGAVGRRALACNWNGTSMTKCNND